MAPRDATRQGGDKAPASKAPAKKPARPAGARTRRKAKAPAAPLAAEAAPHVDAAMPGPASGPGDPLPRPAAAGLPPAPGPPAPDAEALGIRDAIRAHVPDAIRELARLAHEASSEQARVSAINALIDRGYGNLKQVSDADEAAHDITVRFVAPDPKPRDRDP